MNNLSSKSSRCAIHNSTSSSSSHNSYNSLSSLRLIIPNASSHSDKILSSIFEANKSIKFSNDDVSKSGNTIYVDRPDLGNNIGISRKIYAFKDNSINLDKNMQLINIIMPASINFRIISLELEANNANAFIDIFLPLFVGFVTILLLVFMKRYIDKNQKDINTLHALGYTNKEFWFRAVPG